MKFLFSFRSPADNSEPLEVGAMKKHVLCFVINVCEFEATNTEIVC